MSTVAAKLAASPPRPPARGLPMLLTFESDLAARKFLSPVQRFRRATYGTVPESANEGGRVLVTSSEKLLADHLDELRSAHLRIIAISDVKFRDARTDGAVYAYVLPNTPIALFERMVDNAVDHIHLLTTRREVNERLRFATREINELNQIGAALSAEHDAGKLLELILTKSREITSADAGSLYLVEEEDATEAVEYATAGKRLRFKLAQNDSVAVPFREVTMEINQQSVAGYVAQTGHPVNIEDAYHLPEEVPYSINRSFDEDSGYRTKSILAVPMRNQKGEVVGVVQLINSKRDFAAKLTSLAAVVSQVHAFTARQQEVTLSLASQAAVALENSRLYAAIQAMLEGFVKASVTAIEARDPTTSGHSFRVSNLTVAFAEALDRCGDAPFREVKFTRAEMKEIRYAALLHDF